MNTHIRLLKAFIRVLSIPYFISTVFSLALVPERIMMVTSSLPAFRASIMTGAVSLGVTIVLDITAGILLWIFAEPLARKIGRDLSENA